MGRNGSGVRAASDSSIEIGFTYQGRWIRERLKLKPTATNLKKAERFRASVIIAIEQGTFDYAVSFPDSKRLKLFEDTGIPLFKTAAEQWLEQTKRTKRSSTHESYILMVNNQFIPAFGDRRMDQLTHQDFFRWVLARDLIRRTAINYISVIRAIYQYAWLVWDFDYDPFKGHELPTEFRRQQRRISPFTAQERQAILEACPTPADRDMMQFWFWTGLRPSELCALNIEDITATTVQVAHSYTTAASKNTKQREETKTEAGTRRVKLLPLADQAVRSQIARLGTDTGMLWALKPEHRFNPQSLGKRFREIVAAAGVAPRNPYQVRHTYVTMLLMAGESPMWVATQVGHTNWAFTLKVYSQFVPDDMPNAGGLAAQHWTL